MAQDIKKQPTVIQKKNSLIIEDALFYQDITYKKLKEEIEQKANEGLSKLTLIYEIGFNMQLYLQHKGFKVEYKQIGYTDCTIISCND